MLKRFVLSLIFFYRRWLSPLKPPTCRFYPTCSQYAVTAIRRFGIIRGGWLTVVRLVKCHPFHNGGIDHVPGPERTSPLSRPKC